MKKNYFFPLAIIFTLFLNSLPVNASTVNFTTHYITSSQGADQFKIIDLDGDGDLDFVTVHRGGAPGYTWYENDGDENFTTHTTYVNGTDYFAIDVADLDDDGDYDLIIGDEDYPKVLWYSNDGSENFGSAITISSSFGGVRKVRVADIDADGDKDIIVADYAGDKVYFLDNNGSESFTQRTIDSNMDGAYGLMIKDMDDDGDLDVLASGIGTGSTGRMAWYANDGNTPPTWTTNYISSAYSDRYDGYIADLDQDGDQDVVSGSWYILDWWENNGSESFTQHQINTSTGKLNDQSRVVDLDGDGDNDIVTIDSLMGDGMYWFENDGSENFTEHSLDANSNDFNWLEVVDINGDGLLDLMALTRVYDRFYWYEQYADTTAPTVLSLSPDNSATNITTSTNLVVAFDENVDTETGYIYIYDSDDNLFEQIDITSSTQVSGSGTPTTTITLNNALVEKTQYYITIDSTAFDDTSGNSFVGVTSSATWSFTIGDFTAPTVSSLSPADDNTSTSLSANLVLTFNETVSTSTGNISIYKTSDDSLVESIDVEGNQVAGTNTTTITIDPTENFSYSTEYYVIIDASSFTDNSSNDFVGISASTTWSFTTISEPTTTSNNTSNGAPPAPVTPTPAGKGSDTQMIAMNSTQNIGTVSQKGTNVFAYINSTATFNTAVSNSGSPTSQNHKIKIIWLDVLNKKIKIEISSEPQTLELNLDETQILDLDGDEINDIEIKFEDLIQNRPELTIFSKTNQDTETLPKTTTSYNHPLCTIKTDLKIGSKGENIKYLQQYLNNNGYTLSNSGAGSPGNETNYFGSLTQKALIKWQEKNNITTNGTVDALFREQLGCQNISQIKSEIKIENSLFTRDLKLGMTGADILALQQYLNNNGYTLSSSGAGSPGNETNYFGSLTQKALIKWQEDKKINPAQGYFGQISRGKIK